MKKEDIEKVMKENQSQDDGTKVTVTLKDSKGGTFTKELKTKQLCANPEYWAMFWWDRYGFKKFSNRYSWENVVAVTFTCRGIATRIGEGAQ